MISGLLCTAGAHAVDEARNKNKTRAVEAKAIEYSFSLSLNILPSLSNGIYFSLEKC